VLAASRLALPTVPEGQLAPYRRLHVEAVATQVADVGGPLVLVGHSGAYAVRRRVRLSGSS
jgi:hypothetical protein